MIGAEGARRAFAVDIELTGFAAVDMRLNLASIVRNDEKERKLRVREELRKNAPCEVPDDLAVRQRTVNCASHRAKITLSQIGCYRRVSKLAVRKRPACRLRTNRHFARELGAD